VKSTAGEVVTPGEIKSIDGEGMPTYKRPFEKGRLIIRFTVQFPKNITPESSKLLEKALPRPPAQKQPHSQHNNNKKDKSGGGGGGEHAAELEVEDVVLTSFVPNDTQSQPHQHRHRGEAYDEDDEEHPGQQGVSCSQQ